jgi:VIT1/CCC1 family predicted Fe2+/Mn2+ transporter
MAKLTSLSYGSTAAIVTSMGLIVGLTGDLGSRAAVISSLLLVAVADNLSDSLAIHSYQESEKLDARQSFRSTVGNFFARLVVAGSFVVLAVFVPSGYLIQVALVWGLLLLGTLTFLVARSRGIAPMVEVGKHVAVAAVVVLLSRVIGNWILGHAW